jgi:hypothetical protein
VEQGRIIHLRKGFKSAFNNLSGYPPLLATNQEARRVAKGLYMLGFEQKLDRRVPMYFVPNDTLYFDNARSLQLFVNKDSTCTRPYVLNNSTINAVAIGTFNEKDLKSGLVTFNGDFIRDGFCNGSAVAECLSRFTNLQKFVLVNDDCLASTQVTDAEKETKHDSDLALNAFKLSLESSLRSFSDSANDQVLEQHPYYKYDMPMTESSWWDNPTITILNKGAFLRDMRTTDIGMYKPPLPISLLHHMLTT